MIGDLTFACMQAFNTYVAFACRRLTLCPNVYEAGSQDYNCFASVACRSSKNTLCHNIYRGTGTLARLISVEAVRGHMAPKCILVHVLPSSSATVSTVLEAKAPFGMHVPYGLERALDDREFTLFDLQTRMVHLLSDYRRRPLLASLCLAACSGGRHRWDIPVAQANASLWFVGDIRGMTGTNNGAD
jgi:hypothetical protein